MKRNLLGVLVVLASMQMTQRAFAVPAACCRTDGTCVNSPPLGGCLACSGPGYALCNPATPCTGFYISDCLVDGNWISIDSACAAMCENQIAPEQPAPRPVAKDVPNFVTAGASHPVIFWIGLPL